MSKPSRYVDRERYFNELSLTSEKYILPYIQRFHPISQNNTVLEIGCGEGGLLYPFATRNLKVVGIDISKGKIENAALFFRKKQANGVFYSNNILDDNTDIAGSQFDIIITHDVIEHIEADSKTRFMKMMKRYLSSEGIIYVGFPAWKMPYGGHQQMCKHTIAKMPFIHLLPPKAYKAFLERCGEDSIRIEELMSIYKSAMTIESFECLCAESGFEILDRTLWLINPHYQAKFNLFPLKLPSILSTLPHIRNYVSTSCFYILKHQNNA